jgi:hypothetical protein
MFGAGAQKDAAAGNQLALQLYGDQTKNALNTAYGTGTDAFKTAIGAYAPLSSLATQYGQATPMMLNALGLNGPQGTQAATSAFNAGPGYQWQFGQGMDALNRRRAAGGMLNTGNADIDAINYGQGQANQSFNNWLTNLRGVSDTGANIAGTAAGGIASGATGLANLAQNYGQNIAGVNSNVASGVIGDNNSIAQGEATGAKNLLTAGLGLATLGLGGNPFGGSLAGGGGGGGSLLSSLGGMFGGGTPTVMSGAGNAAGGIPYIKYT